MCHLTYLPLGQVSGGGKASVVVSISVVVIIGVVASVVSSVKMSVALSELFGPSGGWNNWLVA